MSYWVDTFCAEVWEGHLAPDGASAGTVVPEAVRKSEQVVLYDSGSRRVVDTDKRSTLESYVDPAASSLQEPDLSVVRLVVHRYVVGACCPASGRMTCQQRVFGVARYACVFFWGTDTWWVPAARRPGA